MNQSLINRLLVCARFFLPNMFLIGVLFSISAVGETLSSDAFMQPNNDYLPKTWMHAMNGNLTKEGFSEDFKALEEAGIGGAIFFHVHRRNWPYSSRGPVRFGTEEFYDHLVHAAAQADKHSIEFGIHNADGWTSSGGPWVTPEQSMKRVTWSEQSVSGGNRHLPLKPGFAEGLYKDIAVIAIPQDEYSNHNLFSTGRISSSGSTLNAEVLSDSDWDTEFIFEKNENDEYWVQVELDDVATLRSLQIETPDRHGDAALLISNDGINFKTVVENLRRPRIGARMWAFSPQLVDESQDGFTAKYFRISFTKPITIKRFDLWSVPRINDWLSMNSMERGKLSMTPTIAEAAIVASRDVQVLHRGAIPPEGIAIPEGDWRILRLGYTSTGAFNVPATIEGEGLEVDKFDPNALEHHFDNYVGKLVKKVNEQGIKSLKTTEIDSYEVGGQNWTRGIEKSFKDKFGYDFIPWLPLLTGRVIESPAHTGAVLQEFRQHLSDLMVENYFGEFTNLSNKHGLESYIEPYGWGPFDELAAGGKADRLMGEFWVRDQQYNGRVMAAISSAHVYGKKVVSAESFTSIRTVNWYGHPYFYKHYGDEMWARGINETMFHRFAHQPNNHVKPGMTMDSIGSHIDRTQTWWSNGGTEWFKYLARGSYLLQQGVPDADFLVHLGDIAPLRVGNANNTSVPDGFGYDYVNTDVLINRIRVENGHLVLPEGTRYRALHLTKTQYLHLKTLRKIKELVSDGATVIGDRPEKVIGLSEWPEKHEFDTIVDELWGKSSSNDRKVLHYGKGIISTYDLEETIKVLGYVPDLFIDGKPAHAFAHRRIDNNDLYYFYNDEPSFKSTEIDIREGDGVPEIWHADNGTIEKITDFVRNETRLVTTIPLEPFGSRFVLIRRDDEQPPYDGSRNQLLVDTYANKHNILSKFDSPWEVHFDQKWAGPGDVRFENLIDWTTSDVSGIKHYSGKAVYKNTLVIDKALINQSQPLYLSLGDVQQIAEVSLNGKSIATLWKPPFVLNIQDYVKAGHNELEVSITNTWVNRLIGDEALPDTSGYSMTGDTVPWITENTPPPPSERVTFTGYNFFEKQPKNLQPSGLIGPVTLYTIQKESGPEHD